MRKPSLDEVAQAFVDGVSEGMPPPPEHFPKGGSDEAWAPPFTEKQWKLFLDPARYVLAEGERFSGKTWTMLHKVVKHCWEYMNAHALIVVGVRRQATAGGAFHTLVNDVLPTWKANLDGFDHSKVMQNVEKDQFVWVANKFGGWSMIQLVSIPHGSHLEARIRGVAVSCIFVDELTMIGGTEYFDALIQQLRRPGIPIPAQQYLAATNPDGPSHWVYKRFHEYPKDSKTGEWNRKYAWHHLPFQENPDPQAKEYLENVLEGTANDPVKRQRLLEGIWVDAPTGDAIFASYFQDALHVRGTVEAGLTPKPGLPITVGYDLGDAYSAIIFLQERITKDKTVWVVFDELIYEGREVPYDVMVPELMQRMNYWCATMEHQFTFVHISDRSAFDRFRASSGSYDHRQVEQLSRDQLSRYPDRYSWLRGPVRMIECPKPSGSVAARVKVLINLLQREEIYFSGRCQRLIRAVKYIESKDGEPFTPSRAGNHIHPYDGLTYPLYYHALGGVLATRPTDAPKPEFHQFGN